MALAGTTKLEAVNIMLNTIGEASTTTLDGTLPFEVSVAESTLDEVVKETQMDSYVFNTSRDVELDTASVGGKTKIPVDGSYMRIENTSTYEEYTIRNGYLYSTRDKTVEFTSSVTVDIVYALDFADLPEAVKRYCNIRAARVYADRLVGSKDIRAFSQQDEFEARAKLMNYEAGVDNVNMLHDNAHSSSIVNRRVGGRTSWL